MGKGCPCANPPGSGKYVPVKQPKPRLPKNYNESESEQNPEKKKSSGITFTEYLESKYQNNRNKDVGTQSYNNRSKNKSLLGFVK